MENILSNESLVLTYVLFAPWFTFDSTPRFQTPSSPDLSISLYILLSCIIPLSFNVAFDLSSCFRFLPLVVLSSRAMDLSSSMFVLRRISMIGAVMSVACIQWTTQCFWFILVMLQCLYLIVHALYYQTQVHGHPPYHKSHSVLFWARQCGTQYRACGMFIRIRALYFQDWLFCLTGIDNQWSV